MSGIIRSLYGVVIIFCRLWTEWYQNTHCKPSQPWSTERNLRGQVDSPSHRGCSSSTYNFTRQLGLLKFFWHNANECVQRSLKPARIYLLQRSSTSSHYMVYPTLKFLTAETSSSDITVPLWVLALDQFARLTIRQICHRLWTTSPFHVSIRSASYQGLWFQ